MTERNKQSLMYCEMSCILCVLCRNNVVKNTILDNIISTKNTQNATHFTIPSVPHGGDDCSKEADVACRSWIPRENVDQWKWTICTDVILREYQPIISFSTDSWKKSRGLWTRLSTKKHRRLSPRFFSRGGGGCTQATQNYHHHLTIIPRARVGWDYR